MWTQRDKHTRRMPCEHKIIYQSDTFISQEMPKISADHQKPAEGHGTDFPSQSSEETNLRKTLISVF